MARTIKFTASGCCSALGNFASGDIARNIDDALAAHLVDEARCAKYLPLVKAPPAAEPAAAPAPKRQRKDAAAPTEQPAATDKDD